VSKAIGAGKSASLRSDVRHCDSVKIKITPLF